MKCLSYFNNCFEQENTNFGSNIVTKIVGVERNAVGVDDEYTQPLIEELPDSCIPEYILYITLYGKIYTIGLDIDDHDAFERYIDSLNSQRLSIYAVYTEISVNQELNFRMHSNPNQEESYGMSLRFN